MIYIENSGIDTRMLTHIVIDRICCSC